MREMGEMLGYEFIRNALAAGALVAAACAYLSVYVVFRRIVFVGITLAQVSTAGVGVALLTGLDPTLCALGFSLAAVMAFALFSAGGRVPGDAVIGSAYVAASASAVLIMAVSPLEQGQMLNILFGNILTVDRSYLFLLAAVFGAVGTFHFLFRRPFYFCTFDPEGARAFGYRTGFWEIIFYLSLGIVVSLSIRAVGSLLCFGFLVVPAVGVLSAAGSIGGIFVAAVLLALASTVLGLYLSFLFDLPSGPVICVILVGLALCMRLAAILRKRGKML